MKKYLTDSETDISISIITLTNNWFCFIIQPENRWGKKENWKILIPFWWIWWKIEEWETIEECIKREAKEEIWVDIEIFEMWKQFFVISPKNIKCKNNQDSNRLTPLFIYTNPKSESWRKAFTNIFVYLAKFNVRNIRLWDNPTIIELNENILRKTIKQEVSLEEVTNYWWKLKTKTPLPKDWILFPLPTVKWIIKFLSIANENKKKKLYKNICNY